MNDIVRGLKTGVYGMDRIPLCLEAAQTSNPPIGVCSTAGLGAEAGINFLKLCENYVTDHGGKIVRSDRLAHGELNGFIYPARTTESIFWSETLYSPSGLATLFGLKRKAPT